MNPNLHYGNVDTDKYMRMRSEAFARMISPKLKSNSKILEIGCYMASLLDFLPKGVDYYGVDFDDAAIEAARNKGAKVKKVDFNNQDIDFGEKFDIVVCTEVLEHLMDPHKLMQKIRRLVKDDGYVLISLPNENMIYHRLMSFFGIGIDMCAFELYKHLHLPTIKQNRNFVQKYFRIIKTDYHINPSAKGSRIEIIGKLLTIFPDVFWYTLAKMFPGLFARGIILLCKKQN
jgi:2-polyprenyl-3-methyl-5-hydroxy-6-metoxy-1,4-benzoquinol methylase